MLFRSHWGASSIEHFSDILALATQTTDIAVIILAVPEKFDESYKLAEQWYDDYDNIHISISLVREKNSSKLMNYTPEQLTRVTEKSTYARTSIPDGEAFVMKSINENNEPVMFENEIAERKSYKGWACYAGIEQFFIRANGDTNRCSSAAGTMDPIGNLYTDYTLPTTPIACPVNNCHCRSDVLTSKFESLINMKDIYDGKV